jgi:hypothetical protein
MRLAPSRFAVVRYGWYLYTNAHDDDVTVPEPCTPVALVTVAISLGYRVEDTGR